MKLLIQGWFSLSHSYSIVLQNQLKYWIDNREKWNLELYFDKLPYFSPQWKDSQFAVEKGPLASSQSFISERMWDGEPVDVVYRIGFPYDVSPPPYVKSVLFLFLTCEFATLDESCFIGGLDALKQAISLGHIHFITPSEWSAKALYSFDDLVDKSRIHVIPHGIDPRVFRPLAVSNRTILTMLKRDTPDTLTPFVFLHIGAMTSNKGIVFIVRSFLEIAKKFENCYLLLKGHRELYKSNQFLDSVMQELQPSSDEKELMKRIVYFDDDLTMEQLAQLYNVADCYVSPYMAEGFNIPALEASACGVPVIATANGPTDEFLVESCTLTIPSKVIVQDSRKLLVYKMDDLTKAMENAITNPRLQKIALTLGTAKIHKGFAWSKISERHISLFKDFCIKDMKDHTNTITNT